MIIHSRESLHRDDCRSGLPVRDFIDGTKLAASHCKPEMPVYGKEFKTGRICGSPRTEEQVKRKIENLVDYIKSIQTH